LWEPAPRAMRLIARRAGSYSNRKRGLPAIARGAGSYSNRKRGLPAIARRAGSYSYRSSPPISMYLISR